jgi:glutamate-1-semialdehyde 2,1-aminomutase
MTAGMAAMQLFDRDAVARLNALGDRARSQIAEVIRTADVPACVTGGGSMFRIHMKPSPPVNYRAAYEGPVEAAIAKAVVAHLFDNGIMLIGTCSGMLSTPMTGGEIDALCDTLVGAFRKTREMWPDRTPARA